MKKRRIHIPLVLVVSGLSVLGLLMVYSSSFFTSYEQYGTTGFYVKRQAMWLAAAVVVFVLFSLFSTAFLRAVTPIFLVITLLMLGLVLIPGVGIERNEATRWLGIGAFVFQPSELAKVSLLLYMSYFLAVKQKWLHSFKRGLWPVIVVVLIVSAFILVQPDLGTVISLWLLMVALFVFAQVRWRHLVLIGTAAVLAVTVLAVVSPYRLARLTSFRAPFENADGSGYQLIQSWSAMANGGIFGQGIGQGMMKLGYLPEAHTDFIIAIVAEELGFIGVGLMLGLFFALFVIGFRVALRARTKMGQYLAAGATIQVTAQAVMNLAAASGLMPITGIPLPLISYGGSSLLVTMALLGLIMNVHRQTELRKEKEIYNEATA